MRQICRRNLHLDYCLSHCVQGCQTIGQRPVSGLRMWFAGYKNQLHSFKLYVLNVTTGCHNFPRTSTPKGLCPHTFFVTSSICQPHWPKMSLWKNRKVDAVCRLFQSKTNKHSKVAIFKYFTIFLPPGLLRNRFCSM